MAKVIVSLNHAVLVSEVKLDDYMKLNHYRPDSLVLVDEEKKEPVFAVKVGWEEDASIGKYGIVFGSETRGEGKAAIEIPVPSAADAEIAEVKSHIQIADLDGGAPTPEAEG